MTLFDPDPKLRWLFCMTHPDDEISICCWIRRLTAAGNEVFISWTHATPSREREARTVANLLGVPQERLRFFGAPDGRVAESISELQGPYTEWIGAVAPDRVCCGAFEQGHLDHDATNYLVHRSFSGSILEVPFYHAYLSRVQRINRFADPAGEQVLDLSPEERRFKRAMIRRYPSTNVRSVLNSYEVWQTLRLRPAGLVRTERLRLQTHTDFRTPNLPEPLARWVMLSDAWRRWLRAMDLAERAEPARLAEGTVP
ncbi:MAG: PIG-L family deacetylase [Fimbriimonas ginsengisoli]|nr:PIG-L family deacetylase [Fimbriimonas ginsengisoli]